jgi:hypothetical protein
MRPALRALRALRRPPGLGFFLLLATALATGLSVTSGAPTSLAQTPSPLTITTTSPLPTGNVGTDYTAFITSSGDQGGPHEFRTIAGQLPPGLRLRDNVISGTPTTAGTFSFTAQVTDRGGQQAAQQFSITIVTNVAQP